MIVSRNIKCHLHNLCPARVEFKNIFETKDKKLQQKPSDAAVNGIINYRRNEMKIHTFHALCCTAANDLKLKHFSQSNTSS